MAEPLHIVMPTDVFPPNSGGAGWSAHALALALQARGHRVTAIMPRPIPAGRLPHAIHRLAPSPSQDRLGIMTVEAPYVVARLPFVANWYRHEWLWAGLRNVIVRETLRRPGRPTVIHAQHVQSVPAAVLAGDELGVPVVATVRDHWPRDYFATGLHGDRLPYPNNTAASLATDLVARLGPLKGVLAMPAIPYMLGHLRRRQQFLARTDAVVAVSRYVARMLPTNIPTGLVRVIPNMIDVDGVRQLVATPGKRRIDSPFIVYVGKVEHNKGAHLLPAAMVAARDALGDHPLPELVIAGDGARAMALQQELTAAGIQFRILPGWTDHDEVLRLMHRAEALVYPSAWGEPLTRVLLEACAAGACIAAMPTGGTPEIIQHNVNGLLASDAAGLGRALASLLRDDALRAHLRSGALHAARTRWSPEVVAGQFEDLYQEVIAGRPVNY